jgi:exodeoxyribonuclease V
MSTQNNRELWKVLGSRPVRHEPAPFEAKLDRFAAAQRAASPTPPAAPRASAIVRTPSVVVSADTHAWTHGQQRALSELRRWSWGAGGKVFGLFGYAGTGKSTVIQSWVKEQRARTVLMVAPTHKAAAVLSAKADEAGIDRQCGVMTLHRALGMKARLDETTGEETFLPSFAADGAEPPISRARFVVLDECSMVGGDLWRYTVEAQLRYGFRLIVMGDQLQLPPVGDGQDSPTFEAPAPGDRVTLTEVVRHSGIVARTVSALRASMEQPRLVLASGGHDDEGDVCTYPGSVEFLEAFEDLVAGGEEARALAYTNRSVDWLNGRIRRRLFGDDAHEINVGERLVVASTAWDATGELVVAQTEDVVRVTEVIRDVRHPVYTDVLCTIVEIDAAEGDAPYLWALTSDAERASWRAYRKKLEASCKAAGKYGPMTRYRRAFARLRPAYATTIHKAQGSTWDQVFVVQSEILAAYKHRPEERAERDRLLYVAYSRAARGLHVRV